MPKHRKPGTPERTIPIRGKKVGESQGKHRKESAFDTIWDKSEPKKDK